MEAKPTYAELEQKNKELLEKLHKQMEIENQFRNLVESTSDSLYLVDSECRYLFMNQHHALRLNMPKEKITGLAYKDCHSPEQSDAFSSTVCSVYQTGVSVQAEHHSSRDGGYFLRTFSPVRDSTNPDKIIAVTVVSKDITHRQKFEKELQKSEEKYRQLIEYSNEAIFIITAGKINYANKRTENMIGYSIDNLQLFSFFDLVIEEDRAMIQEQQEALLGRNSEQANIIFRMVTREGKTIWVAINSVMIMWENAPATLNFMRDITLQKKSETQLIQGQKMESIGTLAGGIAHDFNNLLMGIQGHSSLALLTLDKNDANYEHLKTIESLVQSGAGLTKQLLGFARGGKYEVKRVDLNALINKTSQTIGRTKKEVTIHHYFENELWPTDLDQGQIEQVLINLFINAAQAMPGGGDLYIETKNTHVDENHSKSYIGKGGRYVKISVTDTGVGMDEKTRERIFEPFFTTKEMGRGTGLGLASVYGIVKNHNGFINVYSEKGQGSTFNIYLPVSRRDKKEIYTLEDPAITRTTGKETILLVDDETMILDVASEMLRNLGYTIITAQNGRDAVDLYKQKKEHINLVIIDMVMPDMSGSEVFDEIKMINPHSKILLSSGYSLNGQAGRIMERGCDGFIQKPFTMSDISRQLRNILARQSSQPRLKEAAPILQAVFDSP
jgi:PAS domain S-box-containing protein